MLMSFIVGAGVGTFALPFAFLGFGGKGVYPLPALAAGLSTGVLAVLHAQAPRPNTELIAFDIGLSIAPLAASTFGSILTLSFIVGSKSSFSFRSLYKDWWIRIVEWSPPYILAIVLQHTIAMIH